jgi:hypothetical protein
VAMLGVHPPANRTCSVENAARASLRRERTGRLGGVSPIACRRPGRWPHGTAAQLRGGTGWMEDW